VSPRPKTFSRRRILATGGALAGATAAFGWSSRMFAAPASEAARDDLNVRRLTFKNLHTPEELEVVYRRGDQYVPEALAQIEVILRDYRTGDRHPMDPHLLDILYEVAQSVRVDPVFTVISGYRSPQTNAMLHERSAGVASHSLHMEGRAIDVRLTHVDCADLADKALGMQRGGVGYYRQSDFVHLDTGRVRTWRG
jgi:uncharacterized protein YcbK (DUF882 family)